MVLGVVAKAKSNAKGWDAPVAFFAELGPAPSGAAAALRFLLPFSSTSHWRTSLSSKKYCQLDVKGSCH